MNEGAGGWSTLIPNKHDRPCVVARNPDAGSTYALTSCSPDSCIVWQAPRIRVNVLDSETLKPVGAEMYAYHSGAGLAYRDVERFVINDNSTGAWPLSCEYHYSCMVPPADPPTQLYVFANKDGYEMAGTFLVLNAAGNEEVTIHLTRYPTIAARNLG